MKNFDSHGCAYEAREAGRRRRCIASCAEQRTGEATYARGRKCENALELRGRAPADFQDRRCTGLFEQQVPVKSVFAQNESTLDKRRRRLWARWGAHRERVEADA